MIKQFVCTNCPKGCHLYVDVDRKNKIINIKGNECSKGEDFAKDEIKAPKRVLTTTVSVINGARPVLPVKTSAPILKTRIFDFMRVINDTQAKAPLKVGDVVIKNVMNSGVDVVSTGIVKKVLVQKKYRLNSKEKHHVI